MAVVIRFATYVLNLDGLLFSQHRTIVLSHQAVTCSLGTSRVEAMFSNIPARRTAPHNSSSGMVRCFKGATLLFAVTNLQVGL